MILQLATISHASLCCEQNNQIIVLFNHEGIPITETMAPADLPTFENNME